MPHYTPLVCQFLENIAADVLETHQAIIYRYIHGRHGVYALYKRGKLYYVGLASDLRRRLKRHLKDRHRGLWDRFSIYLTVGDSHLGELESLLLRIIRPAGNKQIGKFNRRCQNLRKQFARDYLNYHRDQLGEVLGDDDDEDESFLPAEVDGRQPALLPYVHEVGHKLRARFKGRLVRARIRRTGKIRFNGQTYNSPSLAAAAACQRRTCSGWSFWHYERAPGDWVPLRELRR